jgi:SEC-C motif domain protein
MKACPCTSGRAYPDCCAPFHRGEREAETPRRSCVRSFAAFALGDADYLWRTVHPDHEDRALPKDDVLRSLKGASRALKYMRLTILDAQESQVLFFAAVFEKGKDRSFVELSSFVHDGTGWRYVAGETLDARGSAGLEALMIASFPRS